MDLKHPRPRMIKILVGLALGAAAIIAVPAASAAPTTVHTHYVYINSIIGTIGPNHASTPHWYTQWNAANCVNAGSDYSGPHDWWTALVSASAGDLWLSPLQLSPGNVCSPWRNYDGNVWTTVGVGAATYLYDINTWTYTNIG